MTTAYPPPRAFLRQLHLVASAYQYDSLHSLRDNEAITIGRDPRCDIVLDSNTFGGVSRYHAQVSPITNRQSLWQVCDLNSANGTFVNGQRIQQCQLLRGGDRIVLGQNGPTFIFELQPGLVNGFTPTDPDVRPHGLVSVTSSSASSSASDHLTLSQLFPILSTGADLRHKAYLIPGVITVSFVVMLFLAVGNAIAFNLLLAIYMAAGAYFFVYQLCGKPKPWWLLLSTGLLSMLLLLSPVFDLFIWVFRDLLHGDIPRGESTDNVLLLLGKMLIGAGLMEELLKALPVFIVYWVGTQLRSPYRERVGVWEPLDGILLGTASAVGFTLLETLGQYVPEITRDVALQAGDVAGQLAGLQLLIPRLLGSIAGHIAYSGYLGYFIGLSVLKPAKRWQILGIGYWTASGLHALWNASGTINVIVLALVGVFSYAFLAAAILKARAMSPTRSQNFATQLKRSQ